MTGETHHLTILKRAGLLLLAVGILDILYMIYSFSQGQSYSSSLNIFAVIAGLFLLRGSLKAAGIVSWIALFAATATAGTALGVLFLTPLDLTVTQMKLAPGTFAMRAAVFALTLAIALWIARTLLRSEVIAARRKAGMKIRKPYVPAIVGIVASVGMAVALGFTLNGETAAKARTAVAVQLGDDYRYHVSAISTVEDSEGKTVYAEIVAWNKELIRIVPVRWEE